MDGQMFKCIYGQIDNLMNRLVNRWTNGQMNKGIYEYMD